MIDNKIKMEFTPQIYKELLCQYLQSLGDDLLLDPDLMQVKRGSFVLNIRSRLLNNLKLTKKQNRVLIIIERELAKQLKEKGFLEEGKNGEIKE